MPEFNIEVQKTDYGFRVPLPTTEGKVEYDANRFKDNEPGVVTLMSKTGVLGGNVFSLNVSPYRKVGENWVAENLCAGLGEYASGTLEHAAFEALLEASQRGRE